MANQNRKLIYMPIKIWEKLDDLSKLTQLTKVNILDKSLNHFKEKALDKEPHYILLKDLLKKYSQSFDDLLQKFIKLEAKIDEIIRTLNDDLNNN